MNPIRLVAALFGIATCLVAMTAAAASARAPFLGRWLIAEAHPAPWSIPGDASTAPFDDHIVGKTVVYAPTRILGPRPLACSRPHYRMLEAEPDSLFQGGLTAPAAQALALGFRAKRILTLETGCAGWIDYHFIDRSTALFALDNMVYTLRKQAR